MKEQLQRVEVPGAEAAGDRAREVVLAAFAAREPVPEARRGRPLVLALALVAAAAVSRDREPTRPGRDRSGSRGGRHRTCATRALLAARAGPAARRLGRWALGRAGRRLDGAGSARTARRRGPRLGASSSPRAPTSWQRSSRTETCAGRSRDRARPPPPGPGRATTPGSPTSTGREFGWWRGTAPATGWSSGLREARSPGGPAAPRARLRRRRRRAGRRRRHGHASSGGPRPARRTGASARVVERRTAAAGSPPDRRSASTTSAAASPPRTTRPTRRRTPTRPSARARTRSP